MRRERKPRKPRAPRQPRTVGDYSRDLEWVDCYSLRDLNQILRDLVETVNFARGWDKAWINKRIRAVSARISQVETG